MRKQEETHSTETVGRGRYADGLTFRIAVRCPGEDSQLADFSIGDATETRGAESVVVFFGRFVC